MVQSCPANLLWYYKLYQRAAWDTAWYFAEKTNIGRREELSRCAPTQHAGLMNLAPWRAWNILIVSWHFQQRLASTSDVLAYVQVKLNLEAVIYLYFEWKFSHRSYAFIPGIQAATSFN